MPKYWPKGLRASAEVNGCPPALGECGGHFWAPADEEPEEVSDRPLDRQELLLLLLGQLVDLCREAVGGLLDLVVAPALLVLGDLLVLGEGLHPVVGLAPGVADRDPRVLRELAHRLGELLAPLLGQGRHGEPDELAVVARAETQVRLDDALLDLLQLGGVPRLDQDR